MGFVAATPTDTLSLLQDLNLGVHRQVKYQRREDEGTQEPSYTLANGSGSCRDLAVQMVEAARVLGFGARLVSGYLADMEGDLVGTSDAGATHAWAEVFVPGPGWIAFDPTNGMMGDAYLIPAAVVRDISQAVPASGSFVGPDDAFERLDVEVEVREVPQILPL
jgi:transglutaminase-like putative cysteine protease